ncbi:MAG: sensor domain-containing diguanylate cyclase [Pseudomonadota bacterium]
MTSLPLSRRIVFALVLALGGAFLFATYSTIDRIVAEQSQEQQLAVSPVFELVADELLRPLYIAETFASSVDFTTSLDSADLDENALIQRLQEMEAELGLTFFVASERTGKQYLSDGRALDLVADDVRWYFEAKERDKDVMADLGQVGNVHLFFDVAVYSRSREFLGYVGVGKPIQRFIDTFDSYKARYGYDFLFVNERGNIMLSSLPELVVTGAHIPNLASLGWFEHGDETHSVEDAHDGEIIQIDSQDTLISEFGIKDLGWRLLLLTPLEARQAQTTRSLIVSGVSAVISVLLLAAATFYLMHLYKRSLETKAAVDDLTGLPNRTFVQRCYELLQRDDESLCAIIVDLDHFKLINDTYGHDAGDRVLEAAACVFKDALRDKDTIGRWGGEEFVMLVPSTSIDTGMFIAERARKKLESLEIELREATVSITASFGVAFTNAANESLADLLARADKVLYEAKDMGRNKVRLYREAS